MTVDKGKRLRLQLVGWLLASFAVGVVMALIEDPVERDLAETVLAAPAVLIVFPMLVAMLTAGIHWMATRQPMPGLMIVVWVVWASLAAILLIVAAAPKNVVTPGAQMSASQYRSIEALNLLEDGEKIRFFYFDGGAFDIRDRFYLYTDRKFVIYSRHFREPAILIPYPEIRDIRIKYSDDSSDDSILVIITHDGEAFFCQLDDEGERERTFFDVLVDSWKNSSAPSSENLKESLLFPSPAIAFHAFAPSVSVWTPGYSPPKESSQRELALGEEFLGPDHPYLAESLNMAGELRPPNERDLAILEEILGPDHPYLAAVLNTLGQLSGINGQYIEAEQSLERALAIWDGTFGPRHPGIVVITTSLGDLYRVQGRYLEAKQFYARATEFSKETLGQNYWFKAVALNALGELYRNQGEYADAERALTRALNVLETTLSADHLGIAVSLNALGTLYRDEGRYAEAESLYRRALVLSERVLAPGHRNIAAILHNLATVYSEQGQYRDAESLLTRAIEISQNTLGTDHPDTAVLLNALGEQHRAQGRYSEAEPLLRRALESSERAYGSDHHNVGTILHNLAVVYIEQGRYADAESSLRRALAISENSLGLDHPAIAVFLNNLAELYHTHGRYAEALQHVRRSAAILHSQVTRIDQRTDTLSFNKRSKVRNVFSNHAQITIDVAEHDERQHNVLIAEGFEAAQLAQNSSAGIAIARMGIRLSTTESALARLVRARQDALNEWRQVDKALLAAVSQTSKDRNVATETRLRTELAELDRHIDSLDEQLSRDFPAYHELAGPKPAHPSIVQKLLAADEALLSYLVTEDQTILWVVRRNALNVEPLKLNRQALEVAVENLRAGVRTTGTELPSFDTTLAFSLYKALLAPAEQHLEGVRHLLVVLDGPLQSLPFSVLVTKQPPRPASRYYHYRNEAWLIRDYAVTVLPSVSSLPTLRQYAKASSATNPFVGFGDPAIDGHANGYRNIVLSNFFTRGGLANIEVLRRLHPLPDTAKELKRIAHSLGANDSNLYLREQATERHVRSKDLTTYKTVAFATHGLVAGELEGLAEPALVLTPPEQASEADDGLLTASEIAQLRLDADWVILSACNTAASDGTPGAEPLSGLAKAFLYAGSRALLVSHWPVDSEAAVLLTTGLFAEATEHPGIGRAEALRRSMLALLTNPEKPYFAHPMFWAPFVVIGEGGIWPAEHTDSTSFTDATAAEEAQIN
jgi:CHAT domain-containing protein/tetratricopeptide (TPR) repeat protein